MRWMVTIGGIGALAVGVLLGLTLATLAPGAEAAPKQQQAAGGRLIDLPLDASGFTPMVAVGDCHQVRVMWEPSGSGPNQVLTSPDGTTPLISETGVAGIRDAFGSSALYGRVSKSDSTSLAAINRGGATLAYPFLQWRIPGVTSASAWCSFH